MAFSHTLTTTWSDGANPVTQTATHTADAYDGRDISVPAATTDQETQVEFDHDQLELLFLLSDQDVTVMANGPTGGDAIELAAGVPCVWTPDCGLPNPFTEPVTAFYLTNPGDEAAVVKVRILHNATA